MSSNKTDIDNTYRVVYGYNQPIFIAFNVEYYSIVGQNTGIMIIIAKIENNDIDNTFFISPPFHSVNNLHFQA